MARSIKDRVKNTGLLLNTINRYNLINNSKIVCDGNSLTLGTGSTGGETYPIQLSNLGAIGTSNCTVTNLGSGSQTTEDMIADGVAQVDALYDSGLDYNFLLAWEIRNHLVLDAPTNQAAFDEMETYCLARQSAGFKVIVATILPSWTATYRGDSTVAGYNLLDYDRLAINTLLRDNYTDFADGFADLAMIEGLGDLGDNESGGYTFSATRPTTSVNGKYDDGTHLTNSGYADVAQCFLNEIYKIIL